MSQQNKNAENNVPIFKYIYFAILIALILFRIILHNIALYINLANYISMAISIVFVFNSSVPKIQEGRRRNICKAIFLLNLLAFAIAGICILVLSLDIPSVFNDIFTLIALTFCICDKVLEDIIIKLASFISN